MKEFELTRKKWGRLRRERVLEKRIHQRDVWQIEEANLARNLQQGILIIKSGHRIKSHFGRQKHPAIEIPYGNSKRKRMEKKLAELRFRIGKPS